MFLKQINKAYWVMGILLYLLFVPSSIYAKEQTFIFICSFISFVLFSVAILESFRREESFFTKRHLAFSVFLISLVQVLIFSLLSFSIDGDLFLFSKADAIVYYNNSIKMSEVSFWESINYCIKNYLFDDWGAFIWFSVLFRISKSLLFVKLIHVIIGVGSSLLLFDIGYYFMPRRYAYMASLTFFIASFTAAFHTVFLKESIFIFLVIAAFHTFYRFLHKRNTLYLIMAFFLSATIAFFRLPVAIILFGAFVITLILMYTKGIITIVLGFIFFTILITSSYTAITYERYLRAGDVDLIIERKEELAMGGGIVKHAADPLAALIGPFPSIAVKKISNTSLNAAGLFYRLLLAVPFFLGTYYVFRYRQQKLYPLIIFFLFNAVGVAISVKGLEFRLTYPHLSMAYVVAFWWLAKYDYKKMPLKLSNVVIYGWIIIAFALSLIWNLR